MRFASIVFLFSLTIEAFSQNLSAFVDYKNYFYVFDDGVSKQVEFNPIQQYKIGGNAIVYVDYSGTAKVYYNGETTDLRIQSPKEIIATDDFIFVYSAGVLKVFDHGDMEVASPNTSIYFPGDSLIGFFDNNTYALKVFYKGEVSTLEDYLAGSGGRALAGDNVLAWVNKEDHFKIFWHGEITELESTPPDNFRAAMNTLAYIDKFTQAFKVFYKGKTIQLESYRPKNFQVGDNMVAYVDNTGHFKIFYDGLTWDASPFEPPFYKAEDNVLVFGDFQHFIVFYKGKTFQLESYVPSTYKLDFNTVAYIDRDGYLKVFQEGQSQKVSEEKINTFELSRNVLRFTTGLDQNNFFSKGKIY